MLANIEVTNWSPEKVVEWLTGICDNPSWLIPESVINNDIGGKQLVLMTGQDLQMLGATKVDQQEHILEAIESLKYYNYDITNETLQASIFKLSCQTRSLHSQLLTKKPVKVERSFSNSKNASPLHDSPNKLSMTRPKQQVSLDTLASISSIVTTVQQITTILNYAPFSKNEDYRSMKRFILALSIELTSTAQRDQFVDSPNDIIEKSAKALADYCDWVVNGTREPLLIQPCYLERVRIEKNTNENHLGFAIRSDPTNGSHTIDKISPWSPAKRTNRLHEGDEILQINKFIVGWSPKNVAMLLEESSNMSDVVITVKKRPSD